jgi:hypothetical protein
VAPLHFRRFMGTDSLQPVLTAREGDVAQLHFSIEPSSGLELLNHSMEIASGEPALQDLARRGADHPTKRRRK